MQLKNKELSRNSTIGSDGIDQENRTVALAFSSESPVERHFGLEILDHSSGAVDLERLSDAAPLLVDHDPTDQVGVIERASIDNDRVGRVVVRFGRSDRAKEIFQDVADGIRKHVSVGYRILDAERDEMQSTKELDAYRITNWMPHEVSIVSIPADHSVGVNRNLNTETNTMENKENIAPVNDEAQQNDIETAKAVATTKARSAEQARIREITQLTSNHQRGDLLSNAIEGGLSVQEVRETILDDMLKRDKAEKEKQKSASSFVGMSNNEIKNFSISRAAEAAAKGDWSNAGLEKEAVRAIEQQTGNSSRGFYIPMEVMNRSEQTKGTAADGGNLVGTDHLAGSFIENLRNESVVMGLGPTVLSGLRGDVSIPRKTGSSTAYWIAEDGEPTESKATFDNVTLSPKTIAVAVSLSRRLQQQSSPVADGILMSDIIRTSALAIDEQTLNGDGAGNNPVGILNQSGVLTQAVADSGNVPTFAEMVGFRTNLEKVNALTGNLCFLTTPTINGALMTTPKDAGSGMFLVENGTGAGYSVKATNQMPTGRTLFGNFNDVLMGMWGVLDVRVDTATGAANDSLVLRVFQDIDIALRHPQSFCKDA